MIVAGEGVARWVSSRLGFACTPPYTTMGLEKNGELVGGIIFSCFERYDIRATVAGTGWTRGFLEAAGEYVFGQLGCERVTFLTEQDKVSDLVHRMGGLAEGIMRNHFGPGRDAILLGILKSEYRWSKVKQ